MFSIYEENITILDEEVKLQKSCLTKKLRLDLLLIKAVEKGKVDYLESQFSNGVDIDEKKSNGWAMIHSAVATNQVKVVKLLIQHGADVNVQATDNVSGLDNLETPLHLATFIGNDEIAKLLIKNGAKVDVSVKGVTPLHMAVCNNDLEPINMILDKTNNVDPQDENGSTPMHRAIWNRKVEVAKHLISKGANIEAVTKQNMRPIHVAILSGSIEIIEILLNNGARVNPKVLIGPTNSVKFNIKSMIGFDPKSDFFKKHWLDKICSRSKKLERPIELTPLHLAVTLSSIRGIFRVGSKIENAWLSMIECSKKHICSYELLEKDRVKMVQTLLNFNAEIEDDTNLKQTPLLLAAKNGFLEIGKLLIQHGANVNVKDQKEFTPLHLAIMSNQIEFAELLLKNGSHVETPGNGHQPLHGAPNYEAAKLLIDHGANVNTKDLKNNSPIHNAVKRNAIDIVKLMIVNGADIKDKNDEGGDKNDKIGCETLLALAIHSRHIEIAKVLIENGANVSFKDSMGNSPIHYAVESNDIDIVKLLLKEGASIHEKNDEGKTPIHLAISEITHVTHIDIVEVLIANGADVNTMRNGYALIHKAVQNSNLAVTKLLIENFVDINIKTYPDRLSPLHLAIVLGDPYNIKSILMLIPWAGYLRGHFKDNENFDSDIDSDDYDCEIIKSDKEKKIIQNEAVIKTLISCGANVNVETADGLLPLHYAMLMERSNVLHTLLNTGKIDVNFKTSNDETLLMFAFRHGLTQSIPILINYGASLTLRNNDNEDHNEFLMTNKDISKLKQVLVLKQNI